MYFHLVAVGVGIRLEGNLEAIRHALNEHLGLRRADHDLALVFASLRIAFHGGLTQGLDLAILAEGDLDDHEVAQSIVVEGPGLVLIIHNTEEEAVTVILETLDDSVTLAGGLAIFIDDIGGHEKTVKETERESIITYIQRERERERKRKREYI